MQLGIKVLLAALLVALTTSCASTSAAKKEQVQQSQYKPVASEHYQRSYIPDEEGRKGAYSNYQYNIPSYAISNDLERSNLLRLEEEIKYLFNLVDEAEANSLPESKVKFRYDWLRKDLGEIISSIEEFRKRPSLEPRKIAPIKKDYTL